ncbi:CbiX/SirB N-terminal domain-containing protein [Phaeobacter sp. PT47_59]|uniref:sirohydrochlorin chelatase n=1 Tax=Phaeobacter sp. PT47_59 TaxID=3029979 RepID=UPI00237FE76F|nr:CbiX/SirB N-terminal domain-containing protein [Phaeobacter sp. PT47_59]MDE4173505.1 CbiX/SirB N-terminal domain-containing protein [Phaeobacter sp. PT47_59]
MPARKTAILTAHGQPSTPEPPERALAALAQEVSGHLPGWEVRSATLSSSGKLESVMEEDAVIYPFFMARGWFTAKVLPERLKGRSYHLACPFGLDPDLPRLAAQAVQQETGWGEANATVLLAAHGSARGPKAAESAQTFAARLAALLPGARIEPAYVEQSPGIEEVARSLPAHTLCLPFFAQSGDHVRQDIPEALTAAGFAGQVLPVLGQLPGTAQLIAAAISRTDQAL